MAYKKNFQTADFLKKYHPEFPIIMCYGDNYGLIAHFCESYAKITANFFNLDFNNPFCVVKLQFSDLEAQNANLSTEFMTPSMLTKHKIIWLKNIRSNNTINEELKEILVNFNKNWHVTLILEAGILPTKNALRELIEQTPNHAMALPCYLDNKALTSHLIDETLTQHQLSIETSAHRVLLQNLNCDYMLAKNELEKLCLYAAQDKVIRLEHIIEICSDLKVSDIYMLADNILAGELSEFNVNFLHYLLSKGSCDAVLATLLFQLHQLGHLVQKHEKTSTSVQQILREAKPPIHFKRQEKLVQILPKWNCGTVTQALIYIEQQLLQARSQPLLAKLIVQNAAVKITKYLIN